MGLHFLHFQALLYKNFLMSLREWRNTALQAFSPVVFLLILLSLQGVYETRMNSKTVLNPQSSPADNLAKCTPYNNFPCITLAYVVQGTADQKARARSVISKLAARNNPPLRVGTIRNVTENARFPFDFGNADVVEFPDPDSMVWFGMGYPNVTQVAVGVLAEAPIFFAYEIVFNATAKDFGDPTAPLTVQMNAAILDHVAQDPAVPLLNRSLVQPQISFKKRPFPSVRPPYYQDIVSMRGSIWFVCPLLINFVVLLNTLVFEKEQKLVTGLKMMGLRPSMYWLSWLVFSIAMSAFSSLILIAVAFMFDIAVFVNTNFWVLFIVFVLFGIAMSFFAFFCSTFFSTTASANTFGFLIFVVSLILQMVFEAFSIYFWYLPDTNSTFLHCFVFYPPFSFAKAYSDIARLSASLYDPVADRFIAGPGYQWSDLTKGFAMNNLSPGFVSAPTLDSIYLLFMNCAVFGILCYYLQNVLPSADGVMESPWFCFEPSYWCRSRRRRRNPSPEKTRLLADGVSLNADVQAEQLRALRIDDDPAVAVRVLDLRMHFYSGFLARWMPWSKSKPFVAVDGLSFCVDRNSVFCLLGHNGAGKSTTIHMLTGLHSPSGGDALIDSLSVVSEMSDVRTRLGVCPQHDILWKCLSPVEHLEIFCLVRGISDAAERQILIETMLRQIGLDHVRHDPVGSFSGGMRRRLSIAAATVGSPSIIFLDEPTTGLDPVNRRRIWGLIEELKKDFTIFLTTHAMDEAEALSDRIGILADGQLRCVDTSLSLKHRYGIGYTFDLSLLSPDALSEVSQRLLDICPAASFVCVASSADSPEQDLLDDSPSDPSAPTRTGLRARGSNAASQPDAHASASAGFGETNTLVGLNSVSIAVRQGLVDVIKSVLNENEVRVQVPFSSLDQVEVLMLALSRGDWSDLVDFWSTSCPSLEDVFMIITRHESQSTRANYGLGE